MSGAGLGIGKRIKSGMDASREFSEGVRERLRPDHPIADDPTGKMHRFTLRRKGGRGVRRKQRTTWVLKTAIGWLVCTVICASLIPIACVLPGEYAETVAATGVAGLLLLCTVGIAAVVSWLLGITAVSIYRDHHPEQHSAEGIAESLRETMRREHEESKGQRG